MRRLLGTIGGIGLLLGSVVAPSAASASEPVPPLGWGTLAAVSWVEHDPDNLLRMRGNTYTVGVEFEENLLGRNVRGGIGMYQCKPGELIGGIDPGPGQCAYLGSLSLSGPDTTSLTFDRHTGSAALRGTMLATRDDGSHAGSIRVAIAWTGSTIQSQKAYKFGFSPPDGVQYTILGWLTNLSATATGRIGRLDVGDAGNELVSAGTARYSVKSFQLIG